MVPSYDYIVYLVIILRYSQSQNIWNMDSIEIIVIDDFTCNYTSYIVIIIIYFQTHNIYKMYCND